MLSRVKSETVISNTYKYCHINNISYVFTGNKHHNTVILIHIILYLFFEVCSCVHAEKKFVAR